MKRISPAFIGRNGKPDVKKSEIRLTEACEKYLSAIRGCFIGGAIGDALGYPVEFMSYSDIIRSYGKCGIQRYKKDFKTGLAPISDDSK